MGTEDNIPQLKQQLLLFASQLLSVQTNLMLSDLLGFPDKQRDLTLYVNLPIFKYWHLFFVIIYKSFFKASMTNAPRGQSSGPDPDELNLFISFILHLF